MTLVVGLLALRMVEEIQDQLGVITEEALKPLRFALVAACFGDLLFLVRVLGKIGGA